VNKKIVNTNTIHKKKKSKRRSVNKNINLSNASQIDTYNSYQESLSQPFSPDALGSRVPDSFSFPTVTYHSHSTTVLGNAASSGLSLGAVLVIPNPIITLFDMSVLDNGATAANVCVTSTGMNRYDNTVTHPLSAAYGATTQADLGLKFAMYRIASWGIKISNLLPELSATGRIIIAPLPIGDTIPNYIELINGNALSMANSITGLGPATLNSSAMLNWPGAFELSFGDLMRGDVELCGMYTSPAFFEFKSASTFSVVNTSFSGGDSQGVNSSNQAAYEGFKDLTRAKGGVAYLIYFEGVPINTANVLQLEIIQHIEGIAELSQTSGNILIPSTMQNTCVGSTQMVEKAITTVGTIDRATKFITRGADFLQKNRKSIKKTAMFAADLIL
jgi:hypothetical protein